MSWEYLEIKEGRCGGRLTMKGTRFTIAQLLMKLVNSGDCVDDFVYDFGYSRELVLGAIKELSVMLNNKENIY